MQRLLGRFSQLFDVGYEPLNYFQVSSSAHGKHRVSAFSGIKPSGEGFLNNSMTINQAPFALSFRCSNLPYTTVDISSSYTAPSTKIEVGSSLLLQQNSQKYPTLQKGFVSLTKHSKVGTLTSRVDTSALGTVASLASDHTINTSKNTSIHFTPGSVVNFSDKSLQKSLSAAVCVDKLVVAGCVSDKEHWLGSIYSLHPCVSVGLRSKVPRAKTTIPRTELATAVSLRRLSLKFKTGSHFLFSSRLAFSFLKSSQFVVVANMKDLKDAAEVGFGFDFTRD
ncbi:hypothetical protein RCL1_000902 [Eukaryota sp. TZLM3-RCL]